MAIGAVVICDGAAPSQEELLAHVKSRLPLLPRFRQDLDRHPLDGQLVAPALSLAIAHSLTAYDATYAALAVQLGGTVISGDTRFVERATHAGLPVTPV